ncbi:unnamed protein product [Pleuronectes platessa]|uniref:Uncharacterized protein n=1 Tax=Pleuronectes platessa TaxID=8262 RepID=A0A9N7V8A5_PLEPL|nr:unnamed protein product [Pleuronectes platessa]
MTLLPRERASLSAAERRRTRSCRQLNSNNTHDPAAPWETPGNTARDSYRAAGTRPRGSQEFSSKHIHEATFRKGVRCIGAAGEEDSSLCSARCGWNSAADGRPSEEMNQPCGVILVMLSYHRHQRAAERSVSEDPGRDQHFFKATGKGKRSPAPLRLECDPSTVGRFGYKRLPNA